MALVWQSVLALDDQVQPLSCCHRVPLELLCLVVMDPAARSPGRWLFLLFTWWLRKSVDDWMKKKKQYLNCSCSHLCSHRHHTTGGKLYVTAGATGLWAMTNSGQINCVYEGRCPARSHGNGSTLDILQEKWCSDGMVGRVPSPFIYLTCLEAVTSYLPVIVLFGSKL